MTAMDEMDINDAWNVLGWLEAKAETDPATAAVWQAALAALEETRARQGEAEG
jgi:hypothetical protein